MLFTACPCLTVETFHTTCSSERHTEFTRTREMLGESLQIQTPNEVLYIDIQTRGMWLKIHLVNCDFCYTPAPLKICYRQPG